MKKNILILLISILLFACKENRLEIEQNNKKQQHKSKFESKSTKKKSGTKLIEFIKNKDETNYEKITQLGFYPDDGYAKDTSHWKHLNQKLVPKEILTFVKSSNVVCNCNDDICRSCETSKFIQLDDQWNIFAFETIETKNFNNIYIFEKQLNRYEVIDTIFGTVVQTIHKTNKIYDIILQEAYWNQFRPKNIEYYSFKKGKYKLKYSKIGHWSK